MKIGFPVKLKSEKVEEAKVAVQRFGMKKLEKANSEIADKNKQIESKNKKLDEQKAHITKQEAKLKSKQAELDRIYSKLPVRIYLKLKRIFKRILGKKN